MGLSDPHTTTAFDEHIGYAFHSSVNSISFHAQFYSRALILSLMVPGVCLTFTVLCAYAYTARHPVSQQHLNRVSFRLLVYALIAK
jgi:hypothetical protein